MPHPSSPFAAMLALCLGAAPALAQDEAGDAPQSMLILDGSGSMWGQIEGTAKIEIAREAIDRMLADWPQDRDIGLMAYGHRSEGDCGDIEVLAEPGPLDRDAFNRSAAGITPQGKTPIGAAVELAADELSSADRPATIILVTDGRETCQADLCTLGATLEESGTGFTAHVIGFDVEDESGQLACLAEETGGRFIPALDSETLTRALETAREEAPAPLEPAAVEEFDGAALGEDWEIINEQPSGYLLDEGELLTMTVNPGDIASQDAANIFRWTGAEIPDGDHAIVATFTAEMGVVKTLGGREAVIQVGRYEDAENFVVAEITRQGNSNDDMWFGLRGMVGGNPTEEWIEIAGDVGGYDLAQILTDFEEQGARLSLIKRGREYHARLETPGWTLQEGGPDVFETEPVTILRAPGAPAFFVGTRGSEQTLAVFDRMEVQETE